MERNDVGSDIGSNEVGTAGAAGSQGGAAEFSGSATDKANRFDFAGTAETGEQSQNLKDRARTALGSAGGKLADVGSTVRERAGTAKDKLADALESGAERLRNRSHAAGSAGVGDAALAGATATGSTAIAGDGRVAQISDRVAGGMERSAEWLRDADLDNLKAGIEEQVREHPARTLLLAAGLGYLIGRAFRGNQ